MEMIRHLIEWAALGIELLAVAVLVTTIVVMAVSRGTVRYVFQLKTPGAYVSYKHQLGRGLMLGLDLLVAADVVRTVALEPTLHNVVVLGLLVLIRTFLSWSLMIEIEGRWPGQGASEHHGKSAQDTRTEKPMTAR
jgi:uncharacterized membrane protein